MSRAAYDLQVHATAHAALFGHPGSVPGGYLADPSVKTTITAAGLCTTGMRERVHGGDRVLGWKAVEVCPAATTTGT